MAATCSCRTIALRTFVRSVAQVHIPSDNLARTVPWHEARRRQLHQARATRWSAVAGLPYRSIRSVATDAAQDSETPAAAAETSRESPQDDAVRAEKDLPEQNSSGHEMLAREVEAELTRADAIEAAKPRTGRPRKTPAVEPPVRKPRSKAAATEPEAEEKKPRKARKEKAVKTSASATAVEDPETETIAVEATEAKAEAKDKKPKKPRKERKARKTPAVEAAAEDPDSETISVAEIEAEHARTVLAREVARAERKAERERVKKEEQQQAEIAAKRREKEHAQNRPAWAIQKEALKKKFPEGWRPRRKLSPDALNGIRALNEQFPDTYTTEVLSNKFEVSPEAIRRILKSRWEPSPEEEEDRQRRWHNRGVTIWQHYAALGKKPPVKWREAGVGVKLAKPGAGREWEEKRGPPDRDVEEKSGPRDMDDDEEIADDGVNPELARRLTRQAILSRSLL